MKAQIRMKEVNMQPNRMSGLEKLKPQSAHHIEQPRSKKV